MYNSDHLHAFLNRFDEERQQTLIQAYIQSLSAKRSQCHTAMESKDMKELYAALHDIKSLGLTVGAEDLGHKAQDIEKMIKKDESESVYDAMPDLYHHLDHLLDVIQNQQKISA